MSEINKKYNKLQKEVNNIKLNLDLSEKNIKEKQKELDSLTSKIFETFIEGSCQSEYIVIKKDDDLIKNYLQLNNFLKEEIRKNDNRKIDYNCKKRKLKDLSIQFPNLEKELPKKDKFKQIGDKDINYNIGLYNKECPKPVAVCELKNVYLSYKDVRTKRCLFKNHKPCSHLRWLNMQDNLY